MPSLAEELLKLSELFSSGVLSEEEFKAAKEATIKRYTLSTTSPEEKKEGQIRDHSPFTQVDIGGFSDDAAGHSQREKAYDLLETILNNLQNFSGNPKYRQLRLSNPTLKTQLFSIPGVMGFLKSIGFVNNSNNNNNNNNNNEEWLRIPNIPRKRVLEEALDAIRFLRSRDKDAMTRTCDYMRLRRSFTLEVRRERCERAKVVGELRSYIIQEFSADDAGDGLSTSSSNLDKIFTILTNILRNPDVSKYRKLRLSNESVYKSVLLQRGGLELLVECAGGEIVEESGEAFIILNEGVSTEGKLQFALQVLEDVRLALQNAREELNQRAREEAKEAMRTELRRIKIQEGTQSRSHRGGNANRELPNGGQQGQDSQQRRRVPFAEAVRTIMGKDAGEKARPNP